MPHLSLRGIARSFDTEPPVHALRGVDLDIEQGAFLVIEGPSGGGKSTLLNTIGLLDRPTTGSYTVGQTLTEGLNDRALTRLRSDRFAFIFQAFHLLDRQPVLHSVELPLMYRGVPAKLRRRLAMRALQTVGVEHLLWQRAGALSGGERQRVAIARALAVGAPIVVADEPTGNLDSDNSQSVVRSLQTLNESGATIVLVTHSTEVAAVATTRARIRDGRLVEPPASLLTAEPAAETEHLPPGRASTLRWRDLLRDAFASVTSRVGRTAGLVAAVAVAVGLAVATQGLAVSANSQVADTFNAHTNRDVTASWTMAQMSAEPAQAQHTLLGRIDAIHGVQTAALVDYFDNHTVQAASDRPSYQVDTYSMTSTGPAAGRMTVRWATTQQHALSAGEVLIGENLAEQLELGPLEAGPIILLDQRPVTVVGLVTSSPRIPEIVGGVVIPYQDRGELGADQGSPEALILTKAGAAQQVAHQAPLVIDPYQVDAIKVDAPIDPTTLRAQVQGDVQTTLIALTGIALLASIAGLANAMILSVMERRQELALRRAVGAGRLHIVSLMLTESAIIGAVGGIGGLAAGLGGILAVTLSRHWAPVFDLRLVPVAILGGIIVGALGGTIAAVRAARIQPAEALRL